MGVKKKFTEEEIVEICRLYVEEKTIKNIAIILNTYPQKIRNTLKENNIKIKKQIRQFTEEDRKEVCRLYAEEGLSLKRIRIFFNSCEAKIRDILIENGISVKKYNQEVDIVEICRLYVDEKLDSRKISSIVGINRKRVVKILKENNIAMKTVKILFSQKDINKICDLYLIEKMSLMDIGKIFKVDSDPIRRILSENNIEIRDGKLNIVPGDKFGRLTIIKEAAPGKRGIRRFLTQCDCGKFKELSLTSLTSGKTQSCRCLHKEIMVERNKECTYKKSDYQENHPFFCEVEEIMDDPNSPGILVKCKFCNEWFRPTGNQLWPRIRSLESPIGFEECNFYCSDKCKHSCILYHLKSDPYEIKDVDSNKPTSNELNIWAKEVLKQQLERENVEHNFCEVCGDRNKLNSHHAIPKKIEPIYTLDPDNGIVACVGCHDKFHKGECSTGALANKVCK